MSVLISIIIPVHGTESFLDKCLDTVVNQTYSNLEIIIVNDDTPDNSEKIILDYQSRDPRIKYVKHDTNKGLFQARRTGFENSTGDYIIHLDSDDTIALNTCASLAKHIEADDSDMVQYAVVWVTGSRHIKRSYHTKPLLGKECFEKNMVEARFYNWTIWSKLYKRELVEKVYQELPILDCIHNSEDYLFNYMAFYLATKYTYCDSATYYYSVHNSPTKHKCKTEAQEERFIQNIQTVAKYIKLFKEKYHIDEQYPVINNEIFQNTTFFGTSIGKLRFSALKKHFRTLCDIFTPERSCDILSKYNSLDRIVSFFTKNPTKEVKVIALYYFRLYNGGVERVMQQLSGYFTEMGYKVVIITDEPPTDDDYPISEFVSREILDVNNRYQSFKKIIQKHNIDTILLNNYWRAAIFTDLIYFNLLNINTVVTMHTTPILGYYFRNLDHPAILFKYLNIASATIGLSEYTKLYFQNHSNKYSAYISNPLTFDPSTVVPNTLETKTIISPGRIDLHKKIDFLIDAFALVLKEVPDAELLLVGEAEPKTKEVIIDKINFYGIADNVKIEGYTTDVAPYFEKGSIYALPSLFEGQPMAWLEAMAHGIPSVVTRKDNVEMSRYPGCIIVEQDDVSGYAEALIKLLKDDALRKQMGQDARESLKYFSKESVKQSWKQLFDSFANNQVDACPLFDKNPAVDEQKALNSFEQLTDELSFNMFEFKYVPEDLTTVSRYKKTVATLQSTSKSLVKSTFESILKPTLKKCFPKNSLQQKFLAKLLRKVLTFAYKILHKINKFISH